MIADHPQVEFEPHAWLGQVLDHFARAEQALRREGHLSFTRHLPRDSSDVTPDRIWTNQEQKELLRQVANDSRSICDHVVTLEGDEEILARLRIA